MSTEAEVATAGKRTGRRAGPTVSHQVILDIACREFAAHGYEGTTMRAIAHAAGVDSALIHHFFLTKQGLFEAAVRGALSPPDLVPRVMECPRGRVGQIAAEVFFTYWDDAPTRERLVGVLRSAVTNDRAGEAVRGFLGNDVILPLVHALGSPEPLLRSALVGSHLLGLATTRYVYRVPAVTMLKPTAVAADVAKTVQIYLTGVL